MRTKKAAIVFGIFALIVEMRRVGKHMESILACIPALAVDDDELVVPDSDFNLIRKCLIGVFASFRQYCPSVLADIKYVLLRDDDALWMTFYAAVRGRFSSECVNLLMRLLGLMLFTASLYISPSGSARVAMCTLRGFHSDLSKNWRSRLW